MLSLPSGLLLGSDGAPSQQIGFVFICFCCCHISKQAHSPCVTGSDPFFSVINVTPLRQGPLKGFLEALGKLQKKFYAKGQRLECPIRTYLVTARSAASSGIRALKTLRAWGLEIDEALFLAGAPKGPMLEKIRPHIYFDDQMFHVEGAAEMGTIAAHVPYGIAQHHVKRNTSGGK